MKFLLFICTLVFSVRSFSQKNPAAFNYIDYKVESIEPASPAILAKQLTSFCKTDLEKTRAIFRWIAGHISYKVKEPGNKRAVFTAAVTESDDTDALKPLNERVADIVLKKKTGICDEYARLFKTLCDYAGLQSEIISGYAKSNIDRPGKRFGCNHSWNAVYIDSAWHLLDVTWASGYISWSSDEFIRSYNDYYFFTPPDQFVEDHYPDDPQWTLMNQPPLPREFNRSPYKQKSFIKYKITSYAPSGGIIEANPGDTLQFELRSADIEYDQRVASDLLLDTAIFHRSDSWVFLQPESCFSSMAGAGKINYRYVVSSANINWLYLMYNDDLLLRYKLNVRNQNDFGRR
ncbi:MAG: transglutaminase domain-containing protein [Chitinophagales bacterium]